MPFVARIDPRTRRTVLDPVEDADLGQDSPEEHAAKMAAPKPPSPIERIATLEAEVAALKAKVGK